MFLFIALVHPIYFLYQLLQTDPSPVCLWYHQASPVTVQMCFKKSRIDVLELEVPCRGLQSGTQNQSPLSLLRRPLPQTSTNSLSFTSFRPWLTSHLPTSLSQITLTPTLTPHCPVFLFSSTWISFQPLCVLLILLILICNSALSSMRGRISSDFFLIFFYCVSSVHLGIKPNSFSK